MALAVNNRPKEVTATLVIWGVLLVIACVALFFIRNNAIEIINHIHYVNVSRGDKARVLYAEAEKNARKGLQMTVAANEESDEKIVPPKAKPFLEKSIALYDEALKVDARPEFSPERTYYYEMLGQVHDANNNRELELLAHARALLSQQNMTDAMENITEARTLAPQSPEPLLLLAQVQDMTNQTTSAQTSIAELMTSYTVTPKAYWFNGQMLNRQGKVAEAADSLEKAVEGEPRNLTFRRDLANVLASLQRYEQAITVLQNGLTDGGWLDAAYLHSYGIFLMRVNDLDEAIRVLNQADKLAPYSGDIQFTLAEAYHKDGKLRQQASALRRAFQAKPSLADKIFPSE